jgi:hypothetical protein
VTFFVLYLGAMGVGFTYWTWWMFYKPRFRLPLPVGDHKYCRDCLWCVPGPRGPLHHRGDYNNARCAHVTSVREPAEVLVHGAITEDNMHSCSVVRKATYGVNGRTLLLPPKGDEEVIGLCGPEGRYWEAR